MATSSITPTLKASARSAYRQVWRASSTTFGGDEPVLRGALATLLSCRRYADMTVSYLSMESKNAQ